MKTNTMFALGLAAALGAGCAASGPVMINGQAVPRAQYRFEGRPYVVKHIDAHPSPTRDVTGYGGRITGPVCGNDVDYEVRHAHGEVTLNGYIDTHFASQIETHDANGERIITGNFGTGAGNSVIDLRLRTNALIGRVGYREYQLMQEGDRLVGIMHIGTNLAVRVTINGRDALWSLPPADMAVILPNLLTCGGEWLRRDGRRQLVVTVGADPGFSPAGSSSLYEFGQ